jgi:signal peptidase II
MNRFNKKDSFYLIISLLIVTFDYIIKLKVKNNMNVGESINVVGNFFKITYIQNNGAAFGMLQEQQNLFLIVGFITIVFLVNLFLKTEDKITKIAISMVIGGAIGNIVDRILYGYVVDMFDFNGVWSYIFNFADICVVLGVALLTLGIIRQK